MLPQFYGNGGLSMKYEFTDEYLTGIAQIDEEHAKLFEIANQAYELLKNEFVLDKYDKIVAVLEELKEYTKYHFGHEEEYMKEQNYQHRFSQMHQHIDFVKKLESYDLKHMDENQQDSLLELIDYLAAWLQGHIKGADKRISGNK